MKILLPVLLLSVFICFAASSSEVTVLTSENFDSLTSSGVWLIKYYAPWCGHCKKLAPTWDELAGVVGDNFHVGKIDCTEQKDVCSRYEVKGYPTILALSNGKTEKYTGPRSINDFISFIEAKYPEVPKTTLPGKAAAATAAPPPPTPPTPAPQAPPAPAPEETSDVVILTDATFSIANSGIWLVDFYAPWCGHCKKLSPVWDQLGSVAKASGLYKVAKIDVSTEKDVAAKFGIRSLPTIKLFIDGVETAYNGERTVDGFNKFVIDAIANIPKAPVVVEEVKEPVVVEEVKDHVVVEEVKEPVVVQVVEAAKDGGVVVLTDENFASTIKGKDFFVKFYAPWCGHCKKLAPSWSELATTHPEYNIGKVDCTVQKDVCSKFEVRGYPTLILLKADDTQVKFQSARNIESFVDFLKKNAQ